jgi:uncharacterized protein (TIGR00725 family)
MKIKVGVMGSASSPSGALRAKAEGLGRAIAGNDVVMLSGATTGAVYVAGKTAHDAGVFHVGVSPAGDENEHIERYKLPIEACDVLIYTGFGLKGRNVVLVRSCDVVLFISGGMGSLNEFTIAHDEGKVIGCLKQTGGVADEVDYLLEKFSMQTRAQIFRDDDPARLIASCLEALRQEYRKE